MSGERDKGDGKERFPVLRYDGGRLLPAEHLPVREYPLLLTVNGVEIATLIASPHDLRSLVAGFLRMQGLVDSVDDFLTFSVCSEFGAASVRIRGEVPPRLTPTLTSGCGAGISFHLPRPGKPRKEPCPPTRYPPESVFALMGELARLAERYRDHGGIHSAAVGNGRSVLLSAEDIGRHNTLDRIAGEALLKKMDLSGMMLATSGRVSSEMVAKAAALGIALIASRTSPTDVAVRMAREAGITLLGYVRGGRFHLYAHPERIQVIADEGFVPGIAGVILAGGSSTRMGSNKALLPYEEGRFIEAIHRRMTRIFREVLLVTNTPEAFGFLPCRKVRDLIPGLGALSGIHAGLHHSTEPRIFVAACDMPYLSEELVRRLATRAEGVDVTIPESDKGLEPLHAIYGKGALSPIEESLRAGKSRVVSFFDKVRVRKMTREEVGGIDPEFRSFRNINTPEEYFAFREGGAATDEANRGKSPERMEQVES